MERKTIKIDNSEALKVTCYRLECPVCGEIMTMDEEPDSFELFYCWNDNCNVTFEVN